MIIRQNTIKVPEFSKENMLNFYDADISFEDAVYFDLEKSDRSHVVL